MKGCLLTKVSSRSVLASTLFYYCALSINSTFASFVASPLVSRTIASSTSFIPLSSLSLQHNLSCTRSSNNKSKNFLISTSNKTNNNIHIHNKSLTTLAQKKDEIMEDSKTDVQHTDPLLALNLPSPLILGSGSFTRKLILQEMNIPFVLKVKPINEYEIGIRDNETYAKELVMTLAKAKADALIQGIIDTNSNNNNSETPDDEGEEKQKDDKFNLNLPNYSSTNEYVVLTADQVVTCNNQILEKPTSIEEAHTFVKQYANNPPQTVGSVVLTHLPSMKQVSGIDISTIYFKSEIEKDCETLVANLLSDDAPILSCAGGLMVEHRFVKEYIVDIDGSEDGVMGLSKALVSRLLNELKNELDS